MTLFEKQLLLESPKCIIPLKIKVSAMIRTIIVTACDVMTGKASVHLLGSQWPETGTFIADECADLI